MLNLLGDLWWRAGGPRRRSRRWHEVLALPGAHLHLYGKTEPRRGRKMGHLTFTAADAGAARDSGAGRPRRGWASSRSEPCGCTATDASAVDAGRARCWPTASWWRFRPRPSMAWARAPTTTLPWRGVFAAKGRPPDHPLIVHVRDAAAARALRRRVPGPMAERLMARLLARPADR